jgi:L-lactate dehydrogenase complex protein LldG
MSAAREQILRDIRRSLRRSRLDPAAETELRGRVAAHRRNLVPARAAALDTAARIDLFVAMAEEAQATVTRVPSEAAVPEAVAAFLAVENLAAEFVMSVNLELEAIPWENRPLLRIRRGAAAPGDMTTVTPAFAGIAETGTLLLISGPGTPTTLNFLPETHIVILHVDRIVAAYEDGWDRLRANRAGSNNMPRTVNFITGPSRTADIEQQIVQGMHGPRRLHIVLIEPRSSPSDTASHG